jgi:hypothetical protein
MLPLFTRQDAARLGRTCKALMGVVREHYKGLGTIKVQQLQSALTTFPRARQVRLDGHLMDTGGSWKNALLHWLKEGRRGEHLALVRCKYKDSSDLVHAALREGALPSLKGMDVDLQVRRHEHH